METDIEKYQRLIQHELDCKLELTKKKQLIDRYLEMHNKSIDYYRDKIKEGL